MTQSTTYSARDKAADQASSVVKQVEDAANTVAQHGREASENVQLVAENFRTAFNKSMRDQPLTTLAMAAAVAFILGALWKS